MRDSTKFVLNDDFLKRCGVVSEGIQQYRISSATVTPGADGNSLQAVQTKGGIETVDTLQTIRADGMRRFGEGAASEAQRRIDKIKESSQPLVFNRALFHEKKEDPKPKRNKKKLSQPP